MTVTIRLEGTKELESQLKRTSGDIRRAVTKAVVGTALELQGNIKKSIRKPGKGTTYYRIYDSATGYTNIFAGDSEGYVRSVKGKMNLSEVHRASADGDPPATDTGRLLNSITFDRLGDLTATVGSKLAYATYLEYGTISMNARPFFRPAVEEISAKYQERLEAAIAGELK